MKKLSLLLAIMMMLSCCVGAFAESAGDSASDPAAEAAAHHHQCDEQRQQFLHGYSSYVLFGQMCIHSAHFVISLYWSKPCQYMENPTQALVESETEKTGPERACLW